MSRALIRPPAARFHVEPQEGPTFPVGAGGTIDSAKNYGSSTTTQLPIDVQWQDRLQVNPAREQPRLVFYSGAQPLIRWGLNRRYTRTFMSASPRFQGRWAYVGFIMRHYTERARMTGVATRQGVTYVMPRVGTGPGPRAIPLGGQR